jgi:hypothetical protein
LIIGIVPLQERAAAPAAATPAERAGRRAATGGWCATGGRCAATRRRRAAAEPGRTAPGAARPSGTRTGATRSRPLVGALRARIERHEIGRDIREREDGRVRMDVEPVRLRIEGSARPVRAAHVGGQHQSRNLRVGPGDGGRREQRPEPVLRGQRFGLGAQLWREIVQVVD